MNIPFVKYRKIYYIFSIILAIACIVVVIIFGLKPGIDFTGGTILEIEYKDKRPSNSEIREKLTGLELGDFYVQPTGEKGVILRMKDIDEKTHQEVLQKIREEDSIEIEEKRFDSIGPTIGKELKSKTNIVIVLVLLSMIIYIALAFRRIKVLRSWQYGMTSVIALFHDILIPLGVFAVLGRLYGIEISISVITALLAVLGYSINNTVVVFDRIRENLLKRGGIFDEIVDMSINQTLTRQLNTSLTTLFVCFAIFFFGGVTLKYFALTLILGISAGVFSSIFLAGPILVTWYKWQRKSP